MVAFPFDMAVFRGQFPLEISIWIWGVGDGVYHTLTMPGIPGYQQFTNRLAGGTLDIHYPFRISSGLKTLLDKTNLAMGKSIHFPWVFYLEKMEIFPCPWLCFSLPKGMISRGWWCGVLESHSLARHQWFFQWIRWLGWRGLKSQLPLFFFERHNFFIEAGGIAIWATNFSVWWKENN